MAKLNQIFNVAEYWHAYAQFDEGAVREHVKMLHQLAAGLDGKFVVAVFYSNPNGEDAKGGSVEHFYVGDDEAMVDAIMAHAETPNANVYVLPNLMRKTLERGKKGSEADVVAVLAIVADQDSDTGNAGDLPVVPDYTVESSPGNYQAWWLLDEPLSMERGKDLARAMTAASNSDSCSSDMAHVWRVPGTINWPNAKKIARGRSKHPKDVRIDLPWSGALTEVSALAEKLAPWANAAVKKDIMAISATDVDADDIPKGVALMLAANDVGDRSAHAARVVERMAFEGMPADKAKAAFLSATGNWFARYDGKDPGRDFDRAWAKFGAEHAETIARAAGVGDALVAKAKAKALLAVNDNDVGHDSRTVAPSPQDTSDKPVGPETIMDPFSPAAVGGTIATVARWITGTAIIPSEQLSLAAAITLFGGLFGSRALTVTEAGVNVYTVITVHTAGGKGWPAAAIRKLADKVYPGAVSGGDPTSDSAIERMLRRNSSTVLVMDEFGITLQGVNQKKHDAISDSIRKFILKVYDQGNSSFDGKAYARSDTKGDDSPLEKPALNIFGMTTIETLSKGLTPGLLSDGFLNRFMFLSAPRPDGDPVPPSLDRTRDVPDTLVRELKRSLEAFPVKPEELGRAAKEKYKVPVEGGNDGVAKALLDAIFRWQTDRRWSLHETQLRARCLENTLRMATLRAISLNPHKPVVTFADLRWAWSVVKASVDNMEVIIAGSSGGAHEELRAAILEVIRKSKDGQQHRAKIIRVAGVKSATLAEYNAAVDWLIVAGLVEDISSKQDKALLKAVEQSES